MLILTLVVILKVSPANNSRVTVANLVLLVFLALRNTPLAPLSGRSYEKLRPLHKAAGYTTIVMMALHAIVYLSAWSYKGSLDKMKKLDNTAGAVAGVAMLVIGFSTIGWFVRKSYEGKRFLYFP